MQIINFIKDFYCYKGSFEFIFSTDYTFSKALFFFHEQSSHIIIKYLKSIFGKLEEISEIFGLYGDKIHHIGVDEGTGRYKFYISLYNVNFKKSLQIISQCKKVLNIQKKYFLEKDFEKFDCIGFDISEKGINMKVYELVDKEKNFERLPKFIKRESIKEIGFLKDFTGRKKKFFRFGRYQEVQKFSGYFDLSKLKSFGRKIKDFYTVKKQVKYYCIEGEKKEIYFY